MNTLQHLGVGTTKISDDYDGSVRNPRSVLKFNRGTRNSKKLHPTQKPVALFEYLIKTYTNEGETVLDNTMGSGTTGVACLNTGRNFIGIELDDKYFDIAGQRIRESRRKLRDERAKKIDDEDDWGED